MRLGHAWLLGCAVCLLAVTARAEVTRYAVLVGNNQGSAGEVALRYAETDAHKVLEVLQQLGDFRPENMVLLQGRGGSELSRVLIALNARIRAESGPGRDSILFVYYSGHADAETLHLGADPVELALVQRLVQGSSASFRVLVLDACRSGALTRVKGAHKTSPFPISLDTELNGEGLALLTSSAADEDAQESDALKGSFFTHYFVSGLRGAADRNENGAVSLEEAYAHAYQHTLRASSQTLYGMQHPTFRFDLKGKGSVPLTWVARGGPRGVRLTLPPGHAYVLFAGDEDGPVVAEIGQHDARRALALEAGRYFVRGRASDHLLEGFVELGPGQNVELQESQLNAVEYARLARKGGTHRVLAQGPWLGYQLRSALWSDATLCHGIRGGYAVDLPSLTLSAGLGACRSRFANEVLRARADELGLDISAAHVFDLPVLSVSLGGLASASLLRQTFETPGRAPARHSVAASLGALLGITTDLAAGYQLFAEALGQAYVFSERRSDGADEVTTTPALRLTLGVGKRY